MRSVGVVLLATAVASDAAFLPAGFGVDSKLSFLPKESITKLSDYLVGCVPFKTGASKGSKAKE